MSSTFYRRKRVSSIQSNINVVDLGFAKSNSELKATRRVSGVDNVVDTGFSNSNSVLKATRRVSGHGQCCRPKFCQE